MQDPDQKCRHFGILWQFMAIYGILVFLPKSQIGNRSDFIRFFPIFRLFLTSQLSDSTALIQTHFQIIQTFFRFSRYIFQIIRTLFRLSGNFPVHPDTLHIIWIFCIAKYPEILQPIMNLSQKLSGFAKTFRSALLTC